MVARSVGRTLVLVLALTGLCLGFMAVAPGTVAVDTVTAEPTDSDEAVIQDAQTLALIPESPGTIEVQHSYTIPDRVTSFAVHLPQRASVVDTSGFAHDGDDSYVWTGDDSTPSITYEAAVNRTIDRVGPIAGPGEYVFVDVGDWALVQHPRPSYEWGWSGEPAISLARESGVEGPGMASEVIAFLGPHDTHVHTVHGQEFVLIEPHASSLAEEPADIFATLAHASDHLRVGERDETVFVVAAPTGEVGWGVRGLQTGSADIWVQDIETLDDPNNVWVHEYVHARQGFSTTADARWLMEATATYYAALYTLEMERISFAEFQAFLADGTDPRYEDVILADPTTWRANSDYVLGALVTGALDREIRVEQEGQRSFTDVFRTLNEHEAVVDHVTVRDALATVGGQQVGFAGEAYLTSTDHPEMWDESAHAAAFGTSPPRISTDVRERIVSGPYRTTTLPADRPPVIVTDEELTLAVEIENRGDLGGSYDIPARIDGVVIERVSGWLEPDERERIEITYPTMTQGTHEVSVGEQRLLVTVNDPAPGSIRSFSVEPTRVERGDSVSVVVTVANDAAYPASATVAITRNDRVVDERSVLLDVAEERTVTATVEMTRSGEISIGVRDTDLPPQVVLVEATGVTIRVIGGAGLLAAMLVAIVILTLRSRRRWQ